MRSAAAAALAILAACGSDDRRDPYDDCHWDCSGSVTCRDGVIFVNEGGPISCERWMGSCGGEGHRAGECEQGCRTDGVTEMGWHYGVDLSQLCEEGRPKAEGEPCTSDESCQPPMSSEDADGGVTWARLTCDPGTGRCVAAAYSPPVDWLGPCALDLSSWPADRIGFIADDGCSEGTCIFQTTDDCLRHACSLRCTGDWMCPDGSACVEATDWNAPREEGRSVCWPASSSGAREPVSDCRAE